MENNNEWIIALYHYLDSILPSGGADEAFRVAPEAIREEIAAMEARQSDIAGISARHKAEAGRAEIGRAAAPAQAEPTMCKTHFPLHAFECPACRAWAGPKRS